MRTERECERERGFRGADEERERERESVREREGSGEQMIGSRPTGYVWQDY